MGKKGKDSTADEATSLIAGVEKHLATGQSTFAGGSFTGAQIVAQLQQLVDLRNAVIAARSAAQARVATEETQRPALLAFASALVQYIRVTFGTQLDVLADFGLAPKKTPTPLTVEQKAAAAAKREATRAARGTKSAKAKKGIKGAVTGVVVSPLVAGPSVVQAPAASTAPTAEPVTGTAPGVTAPKTA
jgi:hypothetical protein